MTFLQELLSFIGLEDRLHLEWISSAEARKFVDVVTGFTERIRELGPNPLTLYTGTKIAPLPWREMDMGDLIRDSEPEPAGISRKIFPVKDAEMKTAITQWLQDGTVDLFLGYINETGHPLPHCFVKERISELDKLVIGPARYSLEKIATHIAAVKPNAKIGMLARDCTRRALNVLFLWQQLDEEQVQTRPVNCCPSGLNKNADCTYLSPPIQGEYKRKAGWGRNLSPKEVERYDRQERLSRWMYEFQKCIKCYGCRDICPVCFCSECSLEKKELVGTGDLPPEAPIFHLVRAVHMAGRCIDCGLCEEACPMDIPLRLLYRKVNDIVMDVFEYQTGSDPEKSPLNILGNSVTLTPRPMKSPVTGDNENEVNHGS